MPMLTAAERSAAARPPASSSGGKIRCASCAVASSAAERRAPSLRGAPSPPEIGVHQLARQLKVDRERDEVLLPRSCR